MKNLGDFDYNKKAASRGRRERENIIKHRILIAGVAVGILFLVVGAFFLGKLTSKDTEEPVEVAELQEPEDEVKIEVMGNEPEEEEKEVSEPVEAEPTKVEEKTESEPEPKKEEASEKKPAPTPTPTVEVTPTPEPTPEPVVEAVPTPAPEQPASNGIKTQFTDCNELITAKEIVNLRTKPSCTDGDSQVVITLYNGMTATRTGINNDVGWSRIDYNGQTLYCVSSFIKVVQ